MADSDTAANPSTDADFPDLSADERDRRWREVRWRMDLAGLDGLLVWGNESKWQSALANNRYLTGRVAPGCILFPLDGDPILWSGFPHDVTKWGAMAGGWVADVRSGHSTTANIVETLIDKGLAKAAIGVVGLGETRPRVIPEVVPYRQFADIRAGLSEARFVDAGWLIEQARIIKGPEEIALLMKSAALAKAMAGALVDAARPGVREHEVYANMLHACLSGGGEEDMIWISSGPVPPPHGKRPPASSRRLEQGDIIVCEYHACYKGYLTGAEISIALGEPRREYQEIHRVCYESQTHGMAAMKPGALLAEAVQAFRQPVMDADFGSVECGFHGHGLASPEFPSCMYGGTAGSWRKHAYARIPAIHFQENMVFATATDLYDPKWNKDTGLMMGRTVLITVAGPKEVTGIPLETSMTVI